MRINSRLEGHSPLFSRDRGTDEEFQSPIWGKGWVVRAIPGATHDRWKASPGCAIVVVALGWRGKDAGMHPAATAQLTKPRRIQLFKKASSRSIKALPKQHDGSTREERIDIMWRWPSLLSSQISS